MKRELLTYKKLINLKEHSVIFIEVLKSDYFNIAYCQQYPLAILVNEKFYDTNKEIIYLSDIAKHLKNHAIRIHRLDIQVPAFGFNLPDSDHIKAAISWLKEQKQVILNNI